jgi:ParB/RepB/Spo0J family partition protein
MPASTASQGKRGRPRKALVSVEQGYKLIELAAIDEPDHAMRETMDETQLHELCESIGKVGLLQPLVVEQHGDRYRVLAGHRRLIACQAIKLALIPCIVRAPGEVDPAAVTIAENYYRENVNAAEEAVFLDRLLTERCGGDTDVLAALIKHKREYVEDRLLLLRGDPAVLQAIKERKITLAVARELQKVTDEGQRAVFLDAAIRGGATSAVVRNWRTSAELQPSAVPASEAGVTGSGEPVALAPAYVMTCFFCDASDDPHLMEMLWVHKPCRKFLERITSNQTQPAQAEKV